jgi:hypothetical protein
MNGRGLLSRTCVGLLALAVVVLAAWRGWCVLSGPDIDTDAYAHHMIARAILADPRDLAVHWVWLPLFHYAQVPLVAAGGTMETVRWMNVGLTAALPVVLFAYLRRCPSPDGIALVSTRLRESRRPAVAPDVVALLAALFVAACPIVMQMGTTAQPEPAFALLILGVAIAFEKRRYLPMSLLLAAAVMLRYEAWAVLIAVAAVLVLGPLQRRLRGLAPEPIESPAAVALAIALPVAFIVLWAALRRPVDGRWFGFLRDTRSFANDALREKSALDRGLVSLLRDALYYPVYVPIKVLGVTLALVPFGILRTIREQGVRFVLVFAACLAFVSFTWVMRSSLGLDRHFVCIVPLYATFAAQGVSTIASAGATGSVARWGHRAMQALATVVALGAMLGLGVELDVWMGHWRGAIARSWPDRRALGAYLRTLPGEPTVFCDEATVEILSGLDRRRFDRHWLDDPHTWDMVADSARSAGAPVYVATWRRKLKGHEAAGDIVFRALESGADASHADDVGLAVMRVEPAPAAAAQQP